MKMMRMKMKATVTVMTVMTAMMASQPQVLIDVIQ